MCRWEHTSQDCISHTPSSTDPGSSGWIRLDKAHCKRILALLLATSSIESLSWGWGMTERGKRKRREKQLWQVDRLNKRFGSHTHPPLSPCSNLNVIKLRVVFLILINVVITVSIAVLIKSNFRSLRTIERHIVNEFQHRVAWNREQRLPAVSAVHATLRLNDVVECMSECIHSVDDKGHESLLFVADLKVLVSRALWGVAPIDFTFVSLFPELIEPHVTTIHIGLIRLVACRWTLIRI